MLYFLRLSDRQLRAFEAVKSGQDMKSHGPLKQNQCVPIHTHSDDAALYVVQGTALFHDGEIEAKLSSTEARFNAVLVPKNHPHGWRALQDDVVVEHTFGHSVNRVFAA